jgi:predicted small metal-binding protein
VEGIAMKTLACGEIMDGCDATFAGETEEEILAQAGRHVVADHGMEVTPEVIDLVRSHIRADRGNAKGSPRDP